MNGCYNEDYYTGDTYSRKRSLSPDCDGSPSYKRAKNIRSVIIVSDWRKECRPAYDQPREHHRTGYNKRCRHRESTESRDETSSDSATRSASSSADSHDLGYCSHHGTVRDGRCNSVRSHWRRDNKPTEKRGMCRCKRHSDSGLLTKSTQNRPGAASRRSERRRRHRRRERSSEEKKRDGERHKEMKRHRRGGDNAAAAARDCRIKRLIVEDKEGQLVYKEDEIIHERYQLGRTLGRGTFGQVVECRDLERNGRKVAIKIVRKGCQDYDSAIMEVRVLEALQEHDRNKTSHCIEMLDWFDYDGHICIVFEMLGHSVYEFQRRNAYRPFPLDQVQLISRQLCQAILFCHEHGITHTDLKPENILFCDSTFNFILDSPGTQWRDTERRVRRADIKVIDFGSALFDYEEHGSIIQTRQYRAPEVILDLGWSYSADVWSIGCIIFELFTGKTLFQTHDTLEHLAMMERVVGHLPSRMIEKSTRKRYFHNGKLKWDVKSREGRKLEKKCRPLKSYVTKRDPVHVELFDLLSGMLQLDPAKRIDIRDAIRHPFFSLHL